MLFRKVGRDGRVLFGDLMQYKQQNDTARHQALDALAAEGQALEMGH